MTGGELVWDWVSLVLQLFGGRKKEAESHMESLLQAMRDQLAARDKSEERLVGELASWRQAAVTLLEKQPRAAIEAASPIGSSVRTLTFSTATSPKTILDEPMADATNQRLI